MVEVETKVQRYERYKESGVEWLGEIPAHWEALANKFIFNLKKSKVGKKSDDYDLLSLTLKGIVIRNLENGGKFPAEFNTYQEVKKGDFVFCLFDVEETPRCVGLSDFDGMITGAYTVMVPNENFDRSFLYYFYLNLDADKRMKPLYSGLRNTISKDNFFAFKTFVPPVKEQTSIAQFLDDKTTKIDDAIAIKEKQINLLKERKQILIHKAVTRGLDDSAPLKYSGVEWIGEIPEHWELTRIKQCSNKISKGTTPSTEGREILQEGKVRFLKSENIFEGFILDEPIFYIDEKTDFIMKRSSLEVNDVLFVIAGASLGKVAVITEEILPANTNQAVAFVRPNNKIHPYFLSKYLVSNTIYELTWLEAVQSAQPNLSMESLGNFPVSLPPLSEQKEISEYIETASRKIETAISLKQQEIEKLKEYKMSLINGVVTGKVKVC